MSRQRHEVGRGFEVGRVTRLLIEGRIRFSVVEPGRVVAAVRSDRTFVVRFQDGEWSCPCETAGACAHVVAVQRMTSPHITGHPVPLRGPHQ